MRVKLSKLSVKPKKKKKCSYVDSTVVEPGFKREFNITMISEDPFSML